MARRVYFASYYEDVSDFRLRTVLSAWVAGSFRETSGIFNAAQWEKAKLQGDAAVRAMIRRGMEGTSVTVVLIGTNSYSRRYTRYEIAKSFERGNAMIGIYVHRIPEQGTIAIKGENPFEYMGFSLDPSRSKIGLLEKRVGTGKWLEYAELPSVHFGLAPYNFLRLKEGAFSSLFSVHDWMDGQGMRNLAPWIETAAKQAGK
ncbi:MAG TPA: TIR domain-containing protein [Chloroflexota bacterium]|nr:TIR domain-containing protein [Chloroflexota bacterium]